MQHELNLVIINENIILALKGRDRVLFAITLLGP